MTFFLLFANTDMLRTKFTTLGYWKMLNEQKKKSSRFLSAPGAKFPGSGTTYMMLLYSRVT